MWSIPVHRLSQHRARQQTSLCDLVDCLRLGMPAATSVLSAVSAKRALRDSTLGTIRGRQGGSKVSGQGVMRPKMHPSEYGPGECVRPLPVAVASSRRGGGLTTSPRVQTNVRLDGTVCGMTCSGTEP